jgi:hypothetical protein
MAKMWAAFNWRALGITTMKCAVVNIVGNYLTVELLSASRELRSVVKEEVRRDSSVSIVTTLSAGRLKVRGSNPGMSKRHFLPPTTESAVRWILWQNGRGVKLTTHLHLVPRLNNWI